MFYISDTKTPLHKAFTVYENPNQTMDQRMSNYSGPYQPHKFNDSSFKNYINSGGISRKEDLTNYLNEIQQRLNQAQEVKGTLTLNNKNNVGGSFRTPPVDLMLKALHGGATAQRFYNKFPIYRERLSPPDVTDDIQQTWEDTINLVPKQKVIVVNDAIHKRSTSNTVLMKNKLGVPLSNLPQEPKNSRISTRAKSISSAQKQQRDSVSFKSLKLSSGQTIQLPVRERFNEDTESAIKEIKDRQSSVGKSELNSRNL
jgi:hypothetical protein